MIFTEYPTICRSRVTQAVSQVRGNLNILIPAPKFVADSALKKHGRDRLTHAIAGAGLVPLMRALD